MQSEDIQILYEKIFSNKDVMNYAFSQKIFSSNETKEFINNYFAKEHSNIGLAPIFEKQNNNLIGFAGILECNYLDKNDFEFGFILAKEFWNQGYATEIGKAQINFAFEKLKLNSILALTNKDNFQSKKVLTKLNMKYEKDIITNERGCREIYIQEKT